MTLFIEHMSVALKGATIVKNLELSFGGPGWLGIVGANGSGKTTFLRALCGRLPIAAGKITIDGNDLSLNRAERARRISIAPEAHLLPGSVTGEQLLAIAAGASNWRSETHELNHLYDALGLGAFINRRISTYSAGMRQRLAIFCPFVTGALHVLLDEPFNWLDPVAAYDLKQQLSGLSRSRYTLVTALHDLSSLYQLCDEGILLANGEIRLRLNAAQLAASERGAEAFENEVITHLRNAEV